MKTSSMPILVRTCFLVAAICLSLATFVLAVPFHKPTIDGSITGNGIDWDPADLVVNDIHDDDLTRTANVRRLWCTWDLDSLYVAVTYQDFSNEEALSVYLDLDRGVGPNDAAFLDNNAGNFLMPDGHRIELVLGRDAADGADLYAGLPPLPRLVTSDNGTTISLAAQANAKQTFNTGTAPSGEDKARFPFWENAEIALPWSAIYPDQGGDVPSYAMIKAVAVAAIASPDSNGYDSAPDNDGMNEDLSAQVLLANLSPSVLDTNGDGQPDPADATVSGTVTLSQDPGTGAVTVQAELIEFAGREPGAPLSVVTPPDGVRAWTLPRLPAGRYRITTRAEGYFSDEFIIDVAQSQAVTGQDQTLLLDTVSGINDQKVTIRPVLLAAHPNPFNPKTTIAFDLPKQTPVSLRVFDMAGRIVRVLLDGEIVAEGRREAIWNGRNNSGQQVAAGVYFYRLDADGYSETKRMALIK